jgi:hypothetical protein
MVLLDRVAGPGSQDRHPLSPRQSTNDLDRERRIRLAYIDGAESWSRQSVGRGFTANELEGVVRRFR